LSRAWAVNVHLIHALDVLRRHFQARSRDQLLSFAGPVIEALTAQDADLDFNRIERAGAFGHVVEFEAPQQAIRLGRCSQVVLPLAPGEDQEVRSDPSGNRSKPP